MILRGNALTLPLADDTVDLVVTSPPYFGLRSYQDGGEHYSGQIGDEATPAEFVDALVAATAEMVRVLKPTGSIFVNLGDKYATAGTRQGNGDGIGDYGSSRTQQAKHYGRTPKGFRDKSLIGIPWRYALRCIDDLGLILRAEIIWCLSGGARVYARTATGDRPIMLRDLVRAYRPQDVKLWNGEQWTQVLGWNKTPDDDDALELELRTGERVGCTAGHQWPTQRGVIRADEIRVGDVIETTRLPEPEQPRMPGFLPDEDIGWLVGLYIAEGSRSGKTIQFAGHLNETDRHARLRLIARDLDGSCNVYQTSPNGSTCNLTGAAIVGVLDRYVTEGTAKTKRLRASAWQRSDQFLAAVVDGYLAGDGHFDAKNDRWRLGFTANDEWAADLRTLAARVGAKVSLRRAEHQAFGRSFPGWRGEWRWQPSTHHNAKRDGEVMAIRKSRARDFYDLGVADEPHLFALASGVLTHNSKPNGLPESVTDRVRRSHETWFHFTLSPRYYSAVDEIREAHLFPNQTRTSKSAHAAMEGLHGAGIKKQNGFGGPESLNPLGKLPGSVWTIPTEPLHVPDHLGIDHFAAYPTEWPRRIIQGWSPSGICTACGEGRRPVSVQKRTSNDALRPAYGAGNHGTGGSTLGPRGVVAHIVGEACACTNAEGTGMACGMPFVNPTHSDHGFGKGQWCPGAYGTAPPTRPAVVLDPFGGTGTTALVADALGRNAIHVDMSADYCRLATWRTTDPKQRAKAARREYLPPREQTDGQLDLLEGLGA